MTPTEIENMARRQYNAVGDTFFSSLEIMDYIYKAQMELCKHTGMLKKTYSTTTVADQKEYPKPTNTISIKRLELDGLRVYPISQTENDDLILSSDASTAGNVDYYYEWGDSFFFNTAPQTTGDTIKIYTFSRPQAVSITSTIEVPGEYHLDLVAYVNYQMAIKDENPAAAKAYQSEWAQAMREGRKLERRKLVGDSFKSVTLVDG